MLGMPCKYNPIIHRVLGGGFIKRIRSCVPNSKQLFLYFHMQTGNFVVALWNEKKKDFFDVLNIGPTLARFSQHDMNRLRAMMHRSAPTANRNEILQMKNEANDARYEEHDKEGVRGEEFKHRFSNRLSPRVFVGQVGGG